MHGNNFSQYTNGKTLELRETLLNLKHTLWDLLDEYYYLTNIVYSQIMYEYEMIFGDIEEEIEEKDRLARELSSKIENNSKKSIHNKYNNNYNNKYNNFGNTNQQIDATKSNYVPNCNVNLKYEVTQLYHQLAKKLHPDLAGETYEFKRFWHNIQDSYKQSDVQRLRMFYQTIINDDFTNQTENRRKEEISLKTEIQDIQFNINKLKNRISNLKNQEPYVFKDKLNDKLWIANRKQKLMLKLFHIDIEIINHQSKLRNLSANYQSVS